MPLAKKPHPPFLARKESNGTKKLNKWEAYQEKRNFIYLKQWIISGPQICVKYTQKKFLQDWHSLSPLISCNPDFQLLLFLQLHLIEDNPFRLVFAGTIIEKKTIPNWSKHENTIVAKNSHICVEVAILTQGRWIDYRSVSPSRKSFIGYHPQRQLKNKISFFMALLSQI